MSWTKGVIRANQVSEDTIPGNQITEPFKFPRDSGGRCHLCKKHIAVNDITYASEHHVFCSYDCAMGIIVNKP